LREACERVGAHAIVAIVRWSHQGRVELRAVLVLHEQKPVLQRGDDVAAETVTNVTDHPLRRARVIERRRELEPPLGLFGRVLGQRVRTSRFGLSGCEDAL
jgi:hypothetical protein